MHDDRRIWDETAFVAVVLATLSVAFVVGWVGAAATNSEQPYDATRLTLTLLARETAALLALDFTAKRYLGIVWADLGLHRIVWRQVVVGAVLGLVVTLLLAALFAVLNLRTESQISHAMATGTLSWQLALSAGAGLYSPVVQELVFRGLLLQGLLQRTNAWVAIAVSSAIFALVHAAGGPASVVSALAYGILLGALFVRFRSLTAPIAAHITVNSFLMLHMMSTVHRAGPFGGSSL